MLASVAKRFASKFPTPSQLFTIDFLGGWTKAKHLLRCLGGFDHRDRTAGGGAHCLQQHIAAPAPAPAPAARRRAALARRGGLGLGVATLYMSVIVLIPLAAVAVKAFSGGLSNFADSVTNGVALESLAVTLVPRLWSPRSGP